MRKTYTRPERVREHFGIQIQNPTTDLEKTQNTMVTSVNARTYLDLSDVVIHSFWSDTISGIQRVQLCIGAAIAKSVPGTTAFFLYENVRFDITSLVRNYIDKPDDVFASLRHRYSYLGHYPTIYQPLQRFRRGLHPLLRHNSNRLKPTSADTLFVAGAFCAKPNNLDYYQELGKKGVKLVGLLHDLLPILYPHLTGHDFSAEMERFLRLPMHIIVPSEFTAGDLRRAIKECKASTPLSLHTVQLAHEFPGSPRNESARRPSERLAKLVGSREFALYVSTIEIRKNHLRLFQVWQDLIAECPEGLPYLVVAGKRGWKAEQALNILDQADALAHRLIFIESPTDLELKWLYASCQFTVFPSIFEGWGLPVGEALWFGKPCIASKATSISEVGGDLCLYFSPDDPREMKDAIKTMLERETRKKFSRRIRNAPLRNWNQVGDEIAEIIRTGRKV